MRNTDDLRDSCVRDIDILIPDAQKIFDLYKDVKDKKIAVVDSYENATELWNLRMLAHQLAEINGLVSDLILTYPNGRK